MDPGVWLVSASAAVALFTAFVARPRVTPAVSILILGLAGAGLGWGGMLIQPDPSTFELVAAVAMLAFLVPAHVRIVLGPFGPAR